MKKLFKFIGIILFLFIAVIAIYYFVNNEDLPIGKKGKEADALAIKMFNAINQEAFENTETLKWSFRNEHFYTWNKFENIVHVSWDHYKVTLNTKQIHKSEVYIDGKLSDKKELVKQAQDFFNNDSFWLIAPFKIFDAGTERSIVNYKGKDALLITYTSGGTTPGDSYLWILDEKYFPTSFKMWTKIIPLGGVAATWSDWKDTKTGIKLPTKHKLSLFGMEISMGNVKTENAKADALANEVLKAINHNAYKKTKNLSWSFAGKRHFKWDKEHHVVDVSWDTVRVNLHPDYLEESTVYYNDIEQERKDSTLIKKAWDIFNNDSFWLVAPHKLFDDGTIRCIKIIDNKEALLVKYTKGGTTPGDSYLWILDENNLPISFKMYVPSMKLDGVNATWQNWITTESGTLLPTNHTFDGGRNLNMGIVKGYN